MTNFTENTRVIAHSNEHILTSGRVFVVGGKRSAPLLYDEPVWRPWRGLMNAFLFSIPLWGLIAVLIWLFERTK